MCAKKTYTKFHEWTSGRDVPTIGTNTGAAILPFQTWYRFKEAFTPELVERALKETSGAVRHIVDPFGGSGTTALAAQFLGAKPTMIEVNPFLVDLIRAKIAPVNCDIAADIFQQVMDSVARKKGPKNPTFKGAPATFVEPGYGGRYIFSKDVARRFLAYRSTIDKIENSTCRRLLRVVLGSTAIPVSNVFVSGKGRRYRRGWHSRCAPPEKVDELFREGVLQALSDISRFAARKNLGYRVMLGDARRLANRVGEHDLAVFSPPYPNSFDYTDVYNLELWALGYLANSETNTQLRLSTLRSHVQVVRNFDDGGIVSATLKATVDALNDVKDRLWSPHIPQMVGAYIEDLSIVLGKLSKNMRSHGRVYMVVGDSRYAGVDIPVAKILSEIAPSLDYDLVEAESCRSIRSSPQQGGQRELPETLIVLKRC